MKKMRKVFAILLAVVLIVTFSSCGSTDYKADINTDSSGIQGAQNSTELPSEEESQTDSNTSSNQEDSVIQNSQSSNVSSENKNESNDEKPTDSVGNMDSKNKISLDSSLPDDSYTLKYEDANGIIEYYADICNLKPGESYTGFIKQNTAPQNALKIGVYNSLSERVGSVGFGSSFKQNLGKKLYSFGAISDAHIGYKTAESDLQNALTFFNDDSSVKFVANCGDLSVGGADEKLALYKSIVNNYISKPVYAVAGNHEANRGNLAIDGIKEYTGQNLYYSFTQGNDVYIMVGMYGVGAGLEFSAEELYWLYETLETNRDKRCFVFMHLNPRDGSGDAVDLDLAGDMLNNTYGEVFYSLMSHYTNVTWFHGHTHEKFEIQEVNGMNNYDNVLGCHSVHIPSLSVPKKIINSSELEIEYEASEGYVVDVYENYVVLRGRDFANEKFLPIATYCLNTKTKKISANTYYDDTQTIINSNTNVLKEANTWYEGSIDKKEITKISFVKNDVPTVYDECWDMSLSENNLVKAYRNGTELTIVGNKNGILLNKNSDKLFYGFENLLQIDGLENVNTANVTNFVSAFENCKKLQHLDISSWNLGKIGKFNSLFRNCTSLVDVKLPNNMGKDYKSGNLVNMSQVFENCVSLTEIDLTNLPNPKNRNYYMSGTFRNCTSLKKVVFGKVKFLTMVNTFLGASAIEEVDMTMVDFSICDSMVNAFYGCVSLTTLKLPETMNTSKVKDFSSAFSGCTSLTLDCSGWNTDSCTSAKNFNYNAPGVIPPVLD